MKLQVLNEHTRCTGLCCQRFPLSIDYPSPASVVLDYLRLGVHPDHDTKVTFGVWGMDFSLCVNFSKVDFADGNFILDMLLPIEGPVTSDSLAYGFFTCRHFDGKNCTVYETRPDMCIRYGAAGDCEYEGNGCTQTLPT